LRPSLKQDFPDLGGPARIIFINLPPFLLGEVPSKIFFPHREQADHYPQKFAQIVFVIFVPKFVQIRDK
jgi:hypothetical protein